VRLCGIDSHKRAEAETVVRGIEWVRLEIDVAGFDSTPFAPILSGVAASGIRLTTLTALGDTADQRRRLYDLNAECSADIPDRGTFHTWDEYQRVRFANPSFRAGYVTLALDEDAWVGMSAMSYRDGYDFAIIGMTGVVRSHRRRDIALAMKVFGMNLIDTFGVRKVRAVHHPRSRAMISLNRKLGYVDATWSDHPY
jgi:RimJ/RimL family protein N-acetyltransferase